MQNKDHNSRLPLQPDVLLWFNSGQGNMSNNYWRRAILDCVYRGNTLGMTEQDRNLDPWPPGAIIWPMNGICLVVMWVTNQILSCLSHYYFWTSVIAVTCILTNSPCKVFSSDWHIIKYTINVSYDDEVDGYEFHLYYPLEEHQTIRIKLRIHNLKYNFNVQ